MRSLPSETLPGNPADDANDSTLGPTIDTRRSPPGPSSAASLPRSFGDYVLLAEIARGGMGVVYKARQARLNRLVALKMIRSAEFANEEQVQRFYTEAQAAAKLDHPSIVPVYEVGSASGEHFFSMALMSGASLNEKLKETGPLQPQQAVQILKLVTEAVEYAHAKGIIHRDIKPQNILLDETGLPRLTDFGLAKIAAADSNLTMTGQIMGTPSYMAPEQAAGRRIDVRADVYSLGCVLYACLTGRPPFEAASPAETLRQVLDNEPVSPRTLNPAIPRDLDTMCLKCLEKDPARRYGTAAEFAAELARFLAGQPILARPVGAVERGWRWARRNRGLAIIGGLAAAACLVTIITLSAAVVLVNQARSAAVVLAGENYQLAEANGNLADANGKLAETESHLRKEAQRKSARLSLEKAIDRCRDDAASGCLQLARSLEEAESIGDKPLAQAARWQLGAWRNELITLAAMFPGRARGAWFDPEGKATVVLQNGEIQRWDLKTGQLLDSHATGIEYVSAAGFRGDGRLVLLGIYNRQAQMWNVAESRAIAPPLPLVNAASLAKFSDDGRRAVCCGGETLVWYDGQTGEVLGEPQRLPYPITDVHFSHDSRQLVTVGGGGQSQGTLQIWDAETMRTTGQGLVNPKPISKVAWTHDLRHLVFTGDDLAVKRWSPDKPEEVVELTRQTGPVKLLQVSPDGKLLLIGGQREAQIWRTEDWRPHSPPFAKDVLSSQGEFCADSTSVLIGGSERKLRWWDARTGEFLASPGHHDRQVFRLFVSPQSEYAIASTLDLQNRVWRLASSAERPLKLRHTGQARSAALTPDGQRVLTASDEGRFQWWDARLGQPLEAAPQIGAPARSVAISHDGKWGAGGGDDGVVHLWDALSGKRLDVAMRHAIPITRVAIDGPGRLIASSDAGEIRLWRIPSGEPVGPPIKNERLVRSLEFNREGTRLLVAGDNGEVRIWNVHANPAVLQGTPARTRYQVVDARFSQDGSQFAMAAADQFARVYDTESGEPMGPPLQHLGLVYAVAFSPDGQTLASGGEDQIIRFWNFRTGQAMGSPLEHHSRVLEAQYSDDGRLLLTSASDGGVRLWDTQSGLVAGPIRRHQDVVRLARLSSDGRRILSAGADGLVGLWAVPQPVTETADQAMRDIEVRTGLKLEADGSVIPLSVEQWQSRAR